MRSIDLRRYVFFYSVLIHLYTLTFVTLNCLIVPFLCGIRVTQKAHFYLMRLLWIVKFFWVNLVYLVWKCRLMFKYHQLHASFGCSVSYYINIENMYTINTFVCFEFELLGTQPCSFSLVQFISVEFSSVHFSSVQFISVQFSSFHFSSF